MTYGGAEPVDAGHPLRARAAARPTSRIGSCRASSTARTGPRAARGSTRASRAHLDLARMESPSWSFRADRCATPAVFCGDGGLVHGGASSRSARRASALPSATAGPSSGSTSPTARSRSATTGRRRPRRPTCRPIAGSRASRSPRRAPRRRAASCARSEPFADPGWVSVEQAAELAAHGLVPLALQARSAAADRDGGVRPRRLRRRAATATTCTSRGSAARRMRTRCSGTVGASATRTTSPRPRPCSTTSPANLTPGGTFWAQWTHERGWTPAGTRTARGCTRGRSPTRRCSCSAPGGRLGASLGALEPRRRRRTQRADGAFPAAHHVETGDAVAWEGTAGMAWIPALVEARPTRRGPSRRRLLPAVRELVRRARGRRPRADLRGRLRRRDGLRRARGLGDRAARAADWMLTFRYTYDVAFSPHTLLGRYGFRTPRRRPGLARRTSTCTRSA